METYIKPHSIKFIFAWYDLWIGLFIDRKKKLIYFFPVPMFGIVYKYGYRIYNQTQQK